MKNSILQFCLQGKLTSERVYYRIDQVDKNGERSSGNVFRLEGIKTTDLESKILLWPNPYTSGPVHISIPQVLGKNHLSLRIFDFTGHVYYSGNFAEDQLEQIMERLQPGLYLLELNDNNKSHLLRFMTK